MFSLTAQAGSITHVEGLISGSSLTADAATSLTARTLVAYLSAALTDSGAITVVNQSGLELTDVTTADGSITVTRLRRCDGRAFVQTNGSSDTNDITINTFLPDSGTADLLIKMLTAGGQGDVILDIMGTVTQDGGAVKADDLDIALNGGLTITTEVNDLFLSTRADGDVAVTQQGSKNLTLRSVSIKERFSDPDCKPGSDSSRTWLSSRTVTAMISLSPLRAISSSPI